MYRLENGGHFVSASMYKAYLLVVRLKPFLTLPYQQILFEVTEKQRRFWENIGSCGGDILQLLIMDVEGR